MGSLKQSELFGFPYSFWRKIAEIYGEMGIFEKTKKYEKKC